MEKFLAGRGALVTGSTSGIGHGIAKTLAAAGAKVMLNGFGKPEEIAAARAEVGALMGVAEAPYSAADISKPDAIAQMVADAEAALGSVDILVNTAGIQYVAPIDEFPPEKFEAIMAINFASNWYAIRAVLPGMKKRNWGRIINIASAHGLIASANKSAYVSAKHAQIGLTKTVAIEVAQTPITEAQVPPLAKKFGISEEAALKDHLLEHQPSKRWIEVDEITQAALFLCGPGSSGMTGAALSIDGGWTAG